MTRDEATAALTTYKQVQDGRDPLIRDAAAAGLSIVEIHRLSAIARSTIYRILGGKASHRGAA